MIDFSRRFPKLYYRFWLIAENLMHLFAIKCLATALLLARYQTLQKESTRSDESGQNYLTDSGHLLKLITTLGCSLRGLGWSGVLFCLVYPTIMFCPLFMDKLEKETLRKICSGGMMRFLREPEREGRRLFKYTQFIIKRLQSSNRESGSSFIRDRLSDSMDTIREAMRPTMLKMSGDQLYFLKRLEMSQDLLRPPNRQLSWYKKILNWWLFMYLLTMWTTVFLGVPGTVLLNKLSLVSIKSISPEESRLLTEMDKLDWVFEVLFPVIYIDKASGPLSFILISFVDQNCHLAYIRTRLLRINRKVAHLRETSGKTSDHRGELDCEALEIYISFRVFSHEARRFFRQTQHSILELFCMTLTPFVAAISLLQQEEAKLYIVPLSISLYVALNFCFYPAALLHQRILDTTKLGWSLISQASEFINVGAGSPISTHTLLLWQRLVRDYGSLTFLKTSDIFSIVELSFGSILAVNFYVLSAVVLFFRLFLGKVSL